MTGAEALRLATARLVSAGINGAAQDARVLVAFAMDVPADRLTLYLPDAVTAPGQARLDQMVRARMAHQPVSQITGSRLFWGRAFRVTPDVLDPRPETETLVAAALTAPFGHVLDLGTGSGCILLSLLADRQQATGLGVDLSPAALVIAAQNAADLGIGTRAAFRQSNWLRDVHGTFDLIVANPPYIAADEMPGLPRDVREWEPHLALTPGPDGLAAYRAIAAGAPLRLRSGGRLLVEIGPTQATAVTELFHAAGLADTGTLMDMDGRDRVVTAVKARNSQSA